MRAAETAFPIVGIGASAGGLEALELFLGQVPAGSGMAFVIVQHLDPHHQGLMVELLQRCTTLRVQQARDRMRVKPDCVYVIPRNKDMTILRRSLYLLDPVAPRGLRLPIDVFFRSLAEDQQERGIGVILSGMGSDGTLGLRAIKEKAGVAFVQEPASCRFDSMPRSAIEAGLADVVGPPEALPGRILTYLRHAPLLAGTERVADEAARSAIDKAVVLLRLQTGHDFSLYKRTTIQRRIERRMGIHQILKAADYVHYLRENSQEVDWLFRELLIGVTNFFRDPKAWEQLKARALLPLLANRKNHSALRAWVPGCSTGEEAYSLAMLFKEAVDQVRPSKKVILQIFATDLDKDAIDKAREGVYAANISADVSDSRLKRFFIPVDRGYQVTKPIREMIVFAPQNIIMDPPFTRIDLLCCRNLLIYFTPELQRKLLPLFHHCLNPGGFLFLGTADSIGSSTSLFSPLNAKGQLYRRQEYSLQAPPVEFPSTFVTPRRAKRGPDKPPLNVQALAEQVLLRTFSPAAVLTSETGDILYINGRTGNYIEPAAGKANWNLFAMARDGLRSPLTAAFQRALRQAAPVNIEAAVAGAEGKRHPVAVSLQQLREPEPLRGTVMAVFHDLPPLPTAGPRRASRRAAAPAPPGPELQQELDRARHEVETYREEMQTTQEELKSANEELQSTNEELQSTNEELTTSKEEMQSMNEELETVNQELRVKVDDLSRAMNDMKNLLDSTDIATLFLDSDLRVRRFTSQMSQITRLLPSDVNRPITDIASNPLYPGLAEDVREVLRSLSSVEREIAVPGGRWYVTRILPYRTLDNVIDGVVITFMDITAAKTMEARLRAKEARLRKMLQAG